MILKYKPFRLVFGLGIPYLVDDQLIHPVRNHISLGIAHAQQLNLEYNLCPSYLSSNTACVKSVLYSHQIGSSSFISLFSSCTSAYLQPICSLFSPFTSTQHIISYNRPCTGPTSSRDHLVTEVLVNHVPTMLQILTKVIQEPLFLSLSNQMLPHTLNIV